VQRNLWHFNIDPVPDFDYNAFLLDIYSEREQNLDLKRTSVKVSQRSRSPKFCEHIP
jgi:hypothetical protein